MFRASHGLDVMPCNPPLYSSSNFWLHDEVGGDDDSSSAQEVFIDRAPLPPDDPTKPALSFPAGGGSLQQWDVATQAWV